MNTKNTQNPLGILRTTFNTLISNPIILYPIIILGFIQLIALEILYFSPRFPLNSFLGSIIKARWGESFLHYPLNLMLLPSLFYEAQIVIYILIGGVLMATAVLLIQAVNTDRKINFSEAFKETLRAYIHIFIYSLLSFSLFLIYSFIYNKILERAMKIRSETGLFFILKKTIIAGDTYFQFLAGILITIFLVYVLQFIIIERKNIFKALWLNVKFIFNNIWTTFIIVLVPTAFYLPVLIMRTNINKLVEWTSPEIQYLLVILSIFITVFVDIIILTSATTYFLLKKENS